MIQEVDSVEGKNQDSWGLDVWTDLGKSQLLYNMQIKSFKQNMIKICTSMSPHPGIHQITQRNMEGIITMRGKDMVVTGKTAVRSGKNDTKIIWCHFKAKNFLFDQLVLSNAIWCKLTTISFVYLWISKTLYFDNINSCVVKNNERI